MALTKLTTDLIDSTIVTSVNGSTGAVTLEIGTDWQATPKTANFTAVAGEGYFVDTTSAAITITLPSSPTAGDEVSLVDYGANASTNNITITSSDNIEGAADDLTLSTDKISKTLVYSDATKGWLVTTDAGAEPPAPDLTVYSLVVAGGGGGGVCLGSTAGGGGGGAGGLRTSYGSTSGGGSDAEASLSLFTATNYTVTVGAGGAGKSGDNIPGSKGSDSDFATINSDGGGGGGGNTIEGQSGGSGGGGMESNGVGRSGTSGEGYAGGDGTETGDRGGGGGGASSAGSGATGGSGLSVSITGSAVTYASGGNAIAGGSNPSGNAASNTGNGGISGGSYSQSGGSGIVVVRYPDYYDITVGSGLITGTLNTSVGADEKYTTFTAGTGTITFGAA